MMEKKEIKIIATGSDGSQGEFDLETVCQMFKGGDDLRERLLNNEAIGLSFGGRFITFQKESGAGKK